MARLQKIEGGEVVGVVWWRDRWVVMVVMVVMVADWIEELVYSISQTRPNLAARLLARHSQAIPCQSWLVGTGAKGGGVVGAPLPSDLPIVPSAWACAISALSMALSSPLGSGTGFDSHTAQ
jgi:hypothetical protein